jgi:hypothetical protein
MRATRAWRVLSIAAVWALGSVSTALEAQTDTATTPRPWTELQLQGHVEAEARWRRDEEPAPSSSDIYLRRFEVAGTGVAAPWLTSQFVLQVEDLGLPEAGGDNVTLDEAHLDFGPAGDSPYAVVGVRSQPFGQFESPLVTDPLTQRAYELKAVGLTTGYAGPLGLDVSATIYKGTAHLDGLFASGLIDPAVVRRAATAVTQVSSVVVAIQATPVQDRVTGFGAIVSEPGSDRRNVSADVGATLALARPGLVMDLELVRGLRRATYLGAARPFRDGALSATLAWVFVYHRRATHGRRSFTARRASVHAHPAVVAVRYDAFDDGGLSGVLGAQTMRDQWSVGGRYTWYVAGQIALYSMVELNRSRFRAAVQPPGGTSEWTAYVRAGFVF